MDQTENAASINSFIFACVSVAAIMQRLLKQRLATGVFTVSLPSNGSFCWLQLLGDILRFIYVSICFQNILPINYKQKY
jgi:hypothetical protein